MSVQMLNPNDKTPDLTLFPHHSKVTGVEEATYDNQVSQSSSPPRYFEATGKGVVRATQPVSVLSTLPHYFEVTILEDPSLNNDLVIGWASKAFFVPGGDDDGAARVDHPCHYLVGGDRHSIGFDGGIGGRSVYHDSCIRRVAIDCLPAWRAGDTVGAWFDPVRREALFTLKGVVYRPSDCLANCHHRQCPTRLPYYPVVELTSARVRCNFGQWPFVSSPTTLGAFTHWFDEARVTPAFIVQPEPMRLANLNNDHAILISADGQSALNMTKYWIQFPAPMKLLCADRSIANEKKFYFEVTLVTSDRVLIGWTLDLSPNQLLVAYDGLKRQIFVVGLKKEDIIATNEADSWSAGDTIGCLVDTTTDLFVFTLNSDRIYTVPIPDYLNFRSANLRPAILLDSDQQVYCNFGQDSFVFRDKEKNEKSIVDNEKDNDQAVPHWLETSSSLTVSHDGLEVTGLGMIRSTRGVPLNANRPYYFEVQLIEPLKPKLVVGWATKQFFVSDEPDRDDYIGNDCNSIGFDATDYEPPRERFLTFFHRGECLETSIDVTWSQGTIVGCWFDPVKRESMFTLNGTSYRPEDYFPKIQYCDRSPYYPVLSISEVAATVRFNFGQSPFVYPPTDFGVFNDFFRCSSLGSTNVVPVDSASLRLVQCLNHNVRGLSVDGKSAKCPKDQDELILHTQQAFPIDDKVYFEVTLQTDGFISIGWINFKYGITVVYNGSIHQIQFKSSPNQRVKTILLEKNRWSKGDTIGCSVDPTGRFTFDLNGVEQHSVLPIFPRLLPTIMNDLRPTLHLHSNQHVYCNFGQAPFVFPKHPCKVDKSITLITLQVLNREDSTSHLTVSTDGFQVTGCGRIRALKPMPIEGDVPFYFEVHLLEPLKTGVVVGFATKAFNIKHTSDDPMFIGGDCHSIGFTLNAALKCPIFLHNGKEYRVTTCEHIWTQFTQIGYWFHPTLREFGFVINDFIFRVSDYIPNLNYFDKMPYYPVVSMSDKSSTVRFNFGQSPLHFSGIFTHFYKDVLLCPLNNLSSMRLVNRKVNIRLSMDGRSVLSTSYEPKPRLICTNLCYAPKDILYFEVTLLTNGDIRLGWTLDEWKMLISFVGLKHVIRFRPYDKSKTFTDKTDSWSVGDTIGCSVDIATGQFVFILSTGQQYLVPSIPNPELALALAQVRANLRPALQLSSQQRVYCNFGQDPFLLHSLWSKEKSVKIDFAHSIPLKPRQELNRLDKTPGLIVSTDGLQVSGSGVIRAVSPCDVDSCNNYYEVTLLKPYKPRGVRIGWTTKAFIMLNHLDAVGHDCQSVGFEAEEYPQFWYDGRVYDYELASKICWRAGVIVGFWFDPVRSVSIVLLNGVLYPFTEKIVKHSDRMAYYPTVSMTDASIRINFGKLPFHYSSHVDMIHNYFYPSPPRCNLSIIEPTKWPLIRLSELEDFLFNLKRKKENSEKKCRKIRKNKSKRNKNKNKKKSIRDKDDDWMMEYSR